MHPRRAGVSKDHEVGIFQPDEPVQLPMVRIPHAKALATLRQETFVGKDHASIHVSFSGGVVAVLPGESLDAAIARADALLYAAKRAGRARVFDETQAPAGPAGPTAPT